MAHVLLLQYKWDIPCVRRFASWRAAPPLCNWCKGGPRVPAWTNVQWPCRCRLAQEVWKKRGFA